jgi:hypothetical protein
VNDPGEVVLERPDGAVKRRLVWRGGVLTDRGTTPDLPWYWDATAGINNRGQIGANGAYGDAYPYR